MPAYIEPLNHFIPNALVWICAFNDYPAAKYLSAHTSWRLRGLLSVSSGDNVDSGMMRAGIHYEKTCFDELSEAFVGLQPRLFLHAGNTMIHKSQRDPASSLMITVIFYPRKKPFSTTSGSTRGADARRQHQVYYEPSMSVSPRSGCHFEEFSDLSSQLSKATYPPIAFTRDPSKVFRPPLSGYERYEIPLH
jgi:hypothetical protein